MKNLDLVYDHYKESNNILYSAQHQRELYMRILFILESINFMFLFKSDVVINILHGLLESYKINVSSISDLIQVIQIIMWILISYFLISYFQKNVYIERQYGYMDVLEKEISKISDIKIFNREGSNYTKKYPLFLNLADIFYKFLIPILFFIVHTIKIVNEINNSCNVSCWVCIFKFIIYLWTVILIFSYLIKMKESFS